MKRILYGASVALILFFLFLCPARALAASRCGLHLWFDTLLPTLLPFMILSGILIRADLARPLLSLLTPLFQRLLGLSPGGAYALLIGFLCGCPMGAKTISDLTCRGQICPAEAQYLLGFCNNLSPSFIMTFLVTEQLQRPALLLPTLFIVYGAPLLYGFLTNRAWRRTVSPAPPDTDEKKEPSREVLCFGMVDQCILDAVITVVRLGGYIMLFALLSGIIQTLPLPARIQALLTAAAEITNGIPAVLGAFPFPAAYFFLMILISFGGCSALAQTESVIKSAHLSCGSYVRSKLIICAITALLTGIFLF